MSLLEIVEYNILCCLFKLIYFRKVYITYLLRMNNSRVGLNSYYSCAGVRVTIATCEDRYMRSERTSCV